MKLGAILLLALTYHDPIEPVFHQFFFQLTAFSALIAFVMYLVIRVALGRPMRGYRAIRGVYLSVNASAL